MKKHQEGAAMIVVMCVMVVAVALSLALLLSASVVVTNAVRSSRREQCRILAVSVSEAFCKEVESYQNPGHASSEQEEEMIPLQEILKSVATAEWPSYDASAKDGPDWEKRNVICYELDSTVLPGETVAELYWTEEDEEAVMDLDLEDDLEGVAGLLSGITLYVKVTSTIGEESCSVINCFQPGGVKTDIAESTGSDWKWIYIGHEWEGGDAD